MSVRWVGGMHRLLKEAVLDVFTIACGYTQKTRTPTI